MVDPSVSPADPWPSMLRLVAVVLALGLLFASAVAAVVQFVRHRKRSAAVREMIEALANRPTGFV